jgi:TPP-dependent 2-oxoacid decarboxylase
MSRERLADHILHRIQAAGVGHTFGIPGDFVLPFYSAQARTGLQTVVMTHEPSIGFAADAYARIKGLGVALVTYGAGGLNMVNPVALAYAEESPVLVISGGPEVRRRRGPALLHHCVKTFETQRDVFTQVTEAATILDNPATAATEVDRIFSSLARTSRPAYIEVPRDMVNREIGLELPEGAGEAAPPDDRAVAEAVGEIVDRLRKASHPVMLVGAQVRRFGLRDAVVALAESQNLPVVTSILGKAAFPETHPNFAGNYFGRFGDPEIAEFVEGSDCIVCIGAVLTEMETAGYTARFETGNLVQLNAHDVKVGHHLFPGLPLAAMIGRLQAAAGRFTGVRPARPDRAGREPLFAAPRADGKLTVADMIAALDGLLDGRDDFSVITDTGDCMYAGMSLTTDLFLAPGHYVSMGFAVPAAIGAQLALPARRPVVLVGDGAFQMTGLELGTAVKLGLNPIVVVFNNCSYAMLRFIDGRRDYFDLPGWDYAALARAVGAEGMKVDTRDGFAGALARAAASDRACLIEAVIDAEDISPTLRRLTDHMSRHVKAAGTH